MVWVFFIVVAVLLVGGFAALVTGRIGYDPMAPATTTQADPVLSEHFPASEVSTVRFATAVLGEPLWNMEMRGYRMDQVDAVLDQLQARIAELEAAQDPRDVAAPTPRADG